MADTNSFVIDLEPPRDKDAVRNRWSRYISLLFTVAIVLVVPVLAGAFWGSLFAPIASKIGGLAGFILGTYFLLRLQSRLLVYNPEWSAYVSNDPFGENVPYGPGVHPSHIWEQRNKRGNYSLELVNEAFSVSVQTTTASVEAVGQFQFMIDLRRINNFIGVVGVDESAVHRGFTAFVQSHLTQRLAGKSAEEARASIGELNSGLQAMFAGRDGQVMEFESKLGIIVVSIMISTLKLSDAAQKTRDAIDEAEQLFRVMAKLSGEDPAEFAAKVRDKRIDTKDFERLLNRAMAVSENATMQINVIEGDLGGAAAAALTRLFNNNGGSKKGGKS